jgi:hypothetical protein
MQGQTNLLCKSQHEREILTALCFRHNQFARDKGETIDHENKNYHTLHIMYIDDFSGRQNQNRCGG